MSNLVLSSSTDAQLVAQLEHATAKSCSFGIYSQMWRNLLLKAELKSKKCRSFLNYPQLPRPLTAEWFPKSMQLNGTN